VVGQHLTRHVQRLGCCTPVCATGVSLLARGCLSGATPRRQPWTSAVTLPQRRTGLNARRMAVLWTCRAPSLCRQAHREVLRCVWLDVLPLMPATACHQRNDVERYSADLPRQGLPRGLHAGLAAWASRWGETASGVTWPHAPSAVRTC